MTCNSYFNSGLWIVTINGTILINYFNRKMPVEFTYNYGYMKKKDYSEDTLRKMCVITDKARSSFRKIVKGWMNTSSFAKRMREVILDYDYNYEDAGLKYPKSDSDIIKMHPPVRMELYPNGTLILFVKNPLYENELTQVLLAPVVDSYLEEDTYPAKIASEGSDLAISEIDANYSKNKDFVKFN